MFSVSLPFFFFSFCEDPTYIIPSVTLFLFKPCLNKNICFFTPPLTLVSSHHLPSLREQVVPAAHNISFCERTRSEEHLIPRVQFVEKNYLFPLPFSFIPAVKRGHLFRLICHTISEMALEKENQSIDCTSAC